MATLLKGPLDQVMELMGAAGLLAHLRSITAKNTVTMSWLKKAEQMLQAVDRGASHLSASAARGELGGVINVRCKAAVAPRALEKLSQVCSARPAPLASNPSLHLMPGHL